MNKVLNIKSLFVNLSSYLNVIGIGSLKITVLIDLDVVYILIILQYLLHNLRHLSCIFVVNYAFWSGVQPWARQGNWITPRRQIYATKEIMRFWTKQLFTTFSHIMYCMRIVDNMSSSNRAVDMFNFKDTLMEEGIMNYRNNYQVTVTILVSLISYPLFCHSICPIIVIYGNSCISCYLFVDRSRQLLYWSIDHYYIYHY